MVNKTMGSAIVTPIPLKAPMELHTEGGGGFSFILHPICLFLYYTLSDYSTLNRLIATMYAALGRLPYGMIMKQLRQCSRSCRSSRAINTHASDTIPPSVPTPLPSRRGANSRARFGR